MDCVTHTETLMVFREVPVRSHRFVWSLVTVKTKTCTLPSLLLFHKHFDETFSIYSKGI